MDRRPRLLDIKIYVVEGYLLAYAIWTVCFIVMPRECFIFLMIFV